jgi:hypothetical protein
MGQQAVTNILEAIAAAALGGDGLLARSLIQDWLSGHPDVERLSLPVSQDPMIRSLTAALAELMAQRLGQMPPPWAAGIGPAPRPTHLLRSAARMKRLREACEQSAPLPLRSRGFFVPANYLEAL